MKPSASEQPTAHEIDRAFKRAFAACSLPRGRPPPVRSFAAPAGADLDVIAGWLLMVNRHQWEMEKWSRRLAAKGKWEALGRLKMTIDASNVERCKAIAAIDAATREDAPMDADHLNSEPPGLLFDRLSVLYLKARLCEDERKRALAQEAYDDLLDLAETLLQAPERLPPAREMVKEY